MEAASLFVLIAIICGTLLIRILPKIISKFLEVDAYYFLLTAEEFKKQKRLPVKLPPYYLLDIEEQWYPPGFTIVLGLIPNKILKRIYWIIPSTLDIFNLILLLLLTYNFTDSTLYLALVGVVYAFTPALTSEYLTLTSKSLGNLLLSLEVLSLMYLLQNPNILLLSLAILFCYMLLATHKMTMQFLFLFYIILALIFRNLIPIIILASAFLLLMVTLRGYYVNILRGHYDIVKFWHRNWKYLWAHQIYDSPVYGKTTKDHKGFRERLLRGGGRPIYFFLQSIVGKNGNPHLILPIFAFRLQPQIVTGQVWNLLLIWSASALLIITSVTFIPQLRLFGEGHKYAKMAAFPTSILAIELILHGNMMMQVIATLTVLFSILRWFSIFLSQLSTTYTVGKEDLLKMLEHIKNNSAIDYILCLKGNISDAVVYHCKRRVIWGTHHDCFNTKVIDFYPILRKPIDWFRKTYGVKYVLVDKYYVDPAFIGLNDDLIIKSVDRYVLYKI